MVLVTLSSKGQLVIPKPIREALGLQSGVRLEVRLEKGRIILEPRPSSSPIASLYGQFADVDFLTQLETEHKREIKGEKTLRT
ncbi:MAG: AbrB/MazE/SpoVT family DNA-binding domain-containing protein [Chloroflexi bacterium]|nr:AbrB/MazE/SpoVT family DNA-binding domain-containing protein [Chloroflexota bacterium]